MAKKKETRQNVEKEQWERLTRRKASLTNFFRDSIDESEDEDE